MTTEDMVLLALEMCAAGVVLARIVCIGAALSRKAFGGDQLRFVGLTLAHALLGVGAAAEIGRGELGGLALLGGVALLILSDRRRHRSG